jgi:methylenetetrahydrofolate reductase (NADPH)
MLEDSPRSPSSRATPIRGQLSVSFEFFPPATEEMQRQLWHCIERLAPLDPAFMSVTYGAGGTTRDRTHATVRRLLSETAVPPAAHLTCVGATRAEVDTVVSDYLAAGVRHIVALRGDHPDANSAYAPHPQGYRNAADLVAGIRRLGEFDISVAAYPEKHPDSPSVQADLDNLKRKIDAGANRAITQFFFDNDSYLRFLDTARAQGISVPIIPGIMPVTNFSKLRSFAAKCGTVIPSWLAHLFEGLDDSPEERKLIAAAVAISQCEKLREYGVTNFHFYTLNRPELTRAICHALGVRAAPEYTAQNGVA